MKSATENVLADVIGLEYLHAIIKQVEEMSKTTCHIITKALIKFTLVVLVCSKPYTTCQTSFRALLSYIWL